MSELTVAWTLLAAVPAVGLLTHGAARRGGAARPATLWRLTLMATIAVLLPAVLVSGWLEGLGARWWQSGHHLQLDRSGRPGWTVAATFRAALALPLAFWLLSLASALLWPRGRVARMARWPGGASPWLARPWLIGLALPPMILAVAILPGLGGGPEAFPAAVWALLLTFGTSLCGLAMAADHAADGASEGTVDRETEVESASSAGEPWPETFAQAGLDVGWLATWQAGPAATPKSDRRGGLHRRMDFLGLGPAAPPLVEAIAALLDGRPPGLGGRPGERPRERLVLAPDDCGQIETVTLAADLFGRLRDARTLVLTAGDAQELASCLSQLLPAGDASALVRGAPLPTADLLWVSDVETLGSHVLPKLTEMPAATPNETLGETLDEKSAAASIGLVVWWNADAWSGAASVEVGCVARRLKRVLTSLGRRDLATLVLARSGPGSSGDASSFYRRLLGLDTAPGAMVRVPPRCTNPVALHLLAGSAIDAAHLSATKGWATYLDPPRMIGQEAASRLEQWRSGGLGAMLPRSAARAGARIHCLEPGETRALGDIVCQGGRLTGTLHHVALVPSANPYAHWLLEQEARQDHQRSTARHLLAAQPRSATIDRHILHALSELPATRRGLARTFGGNQAAVHRTLEALGQSGLLHQQEMRRLDRHGKRVVEQRYRLRRRRAHHETAASSPGPWVEVREPAAGGAVRLRLPAERLTIDAYPHRLFLSAGRRYRVRAWSDSQQILERGFASCVLEDQVYETDRLHMQSIFDLEPEAPATSVSRRQTVFERQLATVMYEEEVSGCRRIGAGSEAEVTRLATPIHGTFASRALLLELPGNDAAADPDLAIEGPTALASALRHVLPVDVGVTTDTVAVVTLFGDPAVLGRLGVALVDLYPGGLGLVDALAESDTLLTDLFAHTRQWLSTCRCAEGRRCVLDHRLATADFEHSPHCQPARRLLHQADA